MLNLNNLLVALCAAKKASTHIPSDIRITTAYTEATNGRLAIRVTRPQWLKASDFPKIQDFSPIDHHEPFLLPATAAIELAAKMNKRGTAPAYRWLTAIGEGVDTNGQVSFGVCRNSPGSVVTFPKAASYFPDIDRIIPAGEPVFKVDLDAEAIGKLLTLIARMVGGTTPRVTIAVHQKELNPRERIDTVVITATTEQGQEVVALAMGLPQRKA